MINYKENYNKWLEDNFFDEETREELSNLIDEKEIEDRFYRDLEFGTGGLRGVMGAGTNRMNKYTIGKATKGLGTYLLDHYGVEVCAKKGVVIGYDTRNNSKDFSEITANVLTGMGIKVFLHSEARPTPQLSFSVKFLNSVAVDRVKENDEWWGEGFTEWTNVRKASCLFENHYQPHIPLDDNYYSLDEKKTVEWQTKLANDYIIMFIPFGLLAPMVFERMRKVRFCVFIGFLCSCGFELSQLITQRGYCQLDDVVTNTVGMIVGWGIWKMLSSVGIEGNPLF